MASDYIMSLISQNDFINLKKTFFNNIFTNMFSWTLTQGSIFSNMYENSFQQKNKMKKNDI